MAAGISVNELFTSNSEDVVAVFIMSGHILVNSWNKLFVSVKEFAPMSV